MPEKQPHLSLVNLEREISNLQHPHAQTSFDGGGGGGYDGPMEARVAKLETDLTAIKIDLAVIKANGSTKADIAELKGASKADLADAKTAIIMWVVGAIFVAQLLPMVKDFVKSSTITSSAVVPQAPLVAKPGR